MCAGFPREGRRALGGGHLRGVGYVETVLGFSMSFSGATSTKGERALNRISLNVPMTAEPPRSMRITPVDRRVNDGLERARIVVQTPALLSAIEKMAREHSLTPKQIELVAYSTTAVERGSLVDRLGVSNNTVKTRVRHLLRALDEKSLDTLGKTVLRRALDISAD